MCACPNNLSFHLLNKPNFRPMKFRQFLLPILLATAVTFIPGIFCEDSNSEEILVETKYGTIRGSSLTIGSAATAAGDGEKLVKTFLGIPYARPPLNELRFEKPIEPKKWKGIRNATEMGPACYPYIQAGMWVEEAAHSEDCLYMNILAPGWQPPDGKPFPVLLYVHGGGFQTGTIREQSPEFMAEKYVQKGIVFVAFQYRIGPFGFAATGDEKFPGNYGLWDQKMALEFVQQNIEKFGGDPKRVTVWGFSAGSASVSALSISTHTRDLFRQAIQMSGGLLAEWAVSNRPIGETEKLAKELNCKVLEDSAKLKKCLRGKSVHEFMDAVLRMGYTRRDMNELLFTPRLDADFFTNDPVYLIQEAPPKRTLIGVTEMECLAFTLLGSDEMRGGNFIPARKRANYGRNEFEKFVREIVAPEKAFGEEEAKIVQKRIIDFYLSEKENTSAFFLNKYTEVFTDATFLIPSQLEARLKASEGWPVYLYQTDYFNKKYYPENIPVKGSYHSMELPALFNIRFIPFLIEEDGEDDLAFANVLLNAMTNFVKNGDPSTPELKWPRLSTERPLQYAQLNPRPKIKPALAPEKLQFWQQLNDEFSFDIIRGVHKVTLRSKDEL